LYNEGKITARNPWYIKMSYGSREMFGQWITGIFGATAIFFYRQVIGLTGLPLTLAFVLWSIYNSFNDPIVGYLMEKINFPWEKTTGFRRFPWVYIGGIPWLFSYLAIYLVPGSWTPETHKWALFAWLLISLCLYDTFYTIFDVSGISLFPVKFSGLDERRETQMWGTILGIVGISLALSIPVSFIGKGQETYITAGWVSVIGGVILISFTIPGLFENKRLRQMNLKRSENIEKERPESFIKSFKEAMKNRNFVYKIIFFFGYQASVALINGSALYVITFILDVDEDFLTLLLGTMLIGALLTVPLWLYISKKVNDNKKVSILGAIMMLISYIPMLFVTSKVGWLIALFLFGIGLGGQWFMDPPLMGDVLDDIAVKTGKRQQSIYYGIQTFFIRFGEGFKAFTIVVAHWIGGLPANVETRSELVTQVGVDGLNRALFGIRIHIAIVPFIVVLIGLILFWWKYNLTPENVKKNKELIAEMGLD
ncbi:MAG: MFS transporter, partial [Promethearchaeota archaeon]